MLNKKYYIMNKSPKNAAYIYTVDSNDIQYVTKITDDISLLPLSLINDIAEFNMDTYLKSGQRMKIKLIIINDSEQLPMNNNQQIHYIKILEIAKRYNWNVISMKDGIST